MTSYGLFMETYYFAKRLTSIQITKEKKSFLTRKLSFSFFLIKHVFFIVNFFFCKDNALAKKLEEKLFSVCTKNKYIWMNIKK